jgi:hypothetical protein
MLPDLLHGAEEKVWGNAGYLGKAEAIHQEAPEAQDMTCRRTTYKGGVDEEARRKNWTKSSARAKVEWPAMRARESAIRGVLSPGATGATFCRQSGQLL